MENSRHKFRVWDKEYKQFIQFNKMGFLEDGSLWYVQGVDENEKEINPPYFENQNDWELMQYTGIKDKNGVEIYEGDIVMAEHPHLYASYLGLVSITPGEGLYIEYTDGHVDFGLDEIQYKKYIGVIGNIYEKPDILEGLK